MDGQYQTVLWFFAVLAAAALLIFLARKIKGAAYLSPVKNEMKKEKQWLRRGEYNAAMVKGRQNLEMLLNLVAERNGIRLDNTTQAVSNAKNGQGNGGARRTGNRGQKYKKVMTFQQFGWWLDEHGYLDRVARWELNEVRLIGNRAVHENYSDKEEAWNQYRYMEDLLKLMSEPHPSNGKRRQEQGSRKTDRTKQGTSAQKAPVNQKQPLKHGTKNVKKVSKPKAQPKAVKAEVKGNQKGKGQPAKGGPEGKKKEKNLQLAEPVKGSQEGKGRGKASQPVQPVKASEGNSEGKAKEKTKEKALPPPQALKTNSEGKAKEKALPPPQALKTNSEGKAKEKTSPPMELPKGRLEENGEFRVGPVSGDSERKTKEQLLELSVSAVLQPLEREQSRKIQKKEPEAKTEQKRQSDTAKSSRPESFAHDVIPLETAKKELEKVRQKQGQQVERKEEEELFRPRTFQAPRALLQINTLPQHLPTAAASAQPAAAKQKLVVKAQPVAEKEQKPVIKAQPVAEKEQKPVVKAQPAAEKEQKSVVKAQPVAEKEQKPVVKAQPVVEKEQKLQKKQQKQMKDHRPTEAAAGEKEPAKELQALPEMPKEAQPPIESQTPAEQGKKRRKSHKKKSSEKGNQTAEKKEPVKKKSSKKVKAQNADGSQKAEETLIQEEALAQKQPMAQKELPTQNLALSQEKLSIQKQALSQEETSAGSPEGIIVLQPEGQTAKSSGKKKRRSSRRRKPAAKEQNVSEQETKAPKETAAPQSETAAAAKITDQAVKGRRRRRTPRPAPMPEEQMNG